MSWMEDRFQVESKFHAKVEHETRLSDCGAGSDRSFVTECVCFQTWEIGVTTVVKILD